MFAAGHGGRIRLAAVSFQPIPDKTQVRSELIGERVARWEIVEKIGDGRSGAVYRAKNLDSAQLAAVKVTREAVDEREVRAASQLAHRGIAQVFGFGRLPDGRHWVAMELMDGEGLDWALHRFGNLLVPDTVRVLYEVADALDVAHRAGLIHGNLKPSSVFLVKLAEGGFRVKLLDFGISPTEPGALPSVGGDLRALGVLGFKMLTGLAEVPRELPRPLAPMLPLALDELVADLVEAASKLRPKTAQDVRARLEPLRPLPPKPEELPAPPPALVLPMPAGSTEPTTISAPSAAPAPARRSRALPLIVAGGAFAAALIALIAFLAWPSGDEGPVMAPLPAAPEVRPAPVAVQPAPAPDVVRPRPQPQPKPSPAPVPTEEQLYDRMSRIDAKLRKKGGDYADAVHTLSKQRARLGGSVSVEDRKDIAKQLDAFEKTFLFR